MTSFNKTIPSHRERWFVALLALLPVVTSWDRAGRGFEERWLLLFLGIATWVTAWVLQKKYGHEHGVFRSIWRDPLLYLALIFMGLLLIQWYNAGRELVFNHDSWKWEYGPPPYPAWPSSFRRGEASQMICWFFPAWIMLLTVRRLKWTQQGILLLLYVLLINAGLLSVFGILQFVSGTSNQFWFHRLPGYFFSTFGYPNHAASFFVLNFCLGCGLFFHGVSHHGPRVWRWIALGCILLCFSGALLSLSRTGIAMAFGMMAVVLAYGAVHLFRRGTPVQRLNVGLGALAVTVLVLWTLYSVAGARIVREVERTYEELSITRLVNPPDRSLTGIRYPFWKAAVGISRDYPLFGCGGWGFRYLRKIYIPRETWKTSKGYANVHNDPLNFLVEFGAIGFSCLLGAVFIVVFPLRRRSCFRRNPLLLFLILGLGCVVAHSIIDLPFRCPANLYYWLMLLVLVGEGCGQHVLGYQRGQIHDG
ncbi:MAG: O-antigen ligase family protein [Kiritimatiellae bacterium]|nr:O-antigen ligase family protein [Kiritimatiellia bacterium]MDD4737464.1 O-antigen ligase family protein [Kiritimatiellia bacterium]